MTSMYHADQRALQDRFDSRRLADRLEAVKVHAALSEADARFILARDMLFLATCDPAGQPTCSFKAGDPGFVSVEDARTLVFPCYDGNGMFLSMGNVAASRHVGMLFIDLTSPKRLRVNGTARIEPPDFVAPSFPEAQFVVVVSVREVFPNCPRYIHQYALVERSKFVPHDGAVTPVPAWKQMDWARDVLPAGDLARSES